MPHIWYQSATNQLPKLCHQTMARLTEERTKLYARDPPRGEFSPLTLIPSLSWISCKRIAKYGMTCNGYRTGGQPVLVGCMLSTLNSGSWVW